MLHHTMTKFLGCMAMLWLSGLAAEAQTLPVHGTFLNVDVVDRSYVLDAERNILQVFDHEGHLKRMVGGIGWQDGQFDHPTGLWAKNGIDVFVADYGNHRIQRFDNSLTLVSSLSTRESSNPDERFGFPMGVAVSRQGELFIIDGENIRVVKIGRTNEVERTFGGFGAGTGKLKSPRAIEVGPRDEVYVLDGPLVMVYDEFGNYVTALDPCGEVRPSCMTSDERGLVVACGKNLFWFNEERQHMQQLTIKTPLQDGQTILGIGFSKGQMSVLTADGINREPDPRQDNGLD